MRPGQFPARPLFWEIAYIGGARARGDTVDQWLAAPQDGVLVVRQPVDRTYLRGDIAVHFTLRVAGTDYYWLGPGGIGGGSAAEAPHDVDPRTVKRGAWTEREEFAAAYNAMLDDVVADGVPSRSL